MRMTVLPYALYTVFSTIPRQFIPERIHEFVVDELTRYLVLSIIGSFIYVWVSAVLLRMLRDPGVALRAL